MEKLRDWLASLLILIVLLIASFALDDRYKDEQMQAQILDELVNTSK